MGTKEREPVGRLSKADTVVLFERLVQWATVVAAVAGMSTLANELLIAVGMQFLLRGEAIAGALGALAGVVGYFAGRSRHAEK